MKKKKLTNVDELRENDIQKEENTEMNHTFKMILLSSEDIFREENHPFLSVFDKFSSSFNAFNVTGMEPLFKKFNIENKTRVAISLWVINISPRFMNSAELFAKGALYFSILYEVGSEESLEKTLNWLETLLKKRDEFRDTPIFFLGLRKNKKENTDEMNKKIEEFVMRKKENKSFIVNFEDTDEIERIFSEISKGLI